MNSLEQPGRGTANIGRGLALGLAASVLLSTGLAMMKSRGKVLPPAKGIAIPRAVLRWLCDLVWVSGLGIETLGYLLYFAASAVAPISLVTVMMQGGIAVFVITAMVFLHERANTGEIAGIAGIVLAMVLLTFSLSASTPQGGLNSSALGAFSVGLIILAVILWPSSQIGSNGTAPAIASGIAFGLASLYTKALADIFVAHSGLAIAIRMAVSPWLYLMIGANLAGLVLLQNSFHWTRGIIAMPLSSAISNIVPILGGMIAFGEGLPADRLSAALRMAAFSFTVLAGFTLARYDESIEVKNL